MKSSKKELKKSKKTAKRSIAAMLAIMSCGFALTTAAGCKSSNGWTATAEELTVANAIAGRNTMLIGCWIPPRAHQMRTAEDADARMAELKASGLNCVSTHHSDLEDMNFLKRLLDAAEKNGIKVIIELGTDISDQGISRNIKKVEKTKDHPAVIGYNLYDEPGADGAAQLTVEFRKIREITGPDKLLLINMLPNYGPQSSMAPVITDGLTWYQTYLDTFLKTGTDVLSFDFYPYSANSAGDAYSLCKMMENLSDMAVMTKKYNVPAWGFMQNSSWPGMRAPNDFELLLISHLHLIFGLESYSYFLYADVSNETEGTFVGMLGWDNELTDIYYRVKANNERLERMGYRFLSYSLKGFLTDKLGRLGYPEAIDDSLRLSRDKNLKSVETDYDTLVGVFESRSEEDNIARGYATDTAEKGYYVLNYDFYNDNTVTLRFSESTPYTVWGKDGISSMGCGKSVTITLSPCDAVFVELKTFQN